ncbi:MAG: hypothetical protein RLY93_01800 [Sumerlaeia bacterium]
MAFSLSPNPQQRRMQKVFLAIGAAALVLGVALFFLLPEPKGDNLHGGGHLTKAGMKALGVPIPEPRVGRDDLVATRTLAADGRTTASVE